MEFMNLSGWMGLPMDPCPEPCLAIHLPKICHSYLTFQNMNRKLPLHNARYNCQMLSINKNLKFVAYVAYGLLFSS